VTNRRTPKKCTLKHNVDFHIAKNSTGLEGIMLCRDIAFLEHSRENLSKFENVWMKRTEKNPTQMSPL